jgi:hypothetical protein
MAVDTVRHSNFEAPSVDEMSGFDCAITALQRPAAAAIINPHARLRITVPLSAKSRTTTTSAYL